MEKASYVYMMGSKKLVESMSPGWKDVAADWYSEGLLKDGVLVDFSKAKT